MRTALIYLFALLLSTIAAAHLYAAEPAEPTEALETPFEADLRLGFGAVRTDKNAVKAAQYQYLHSSGAGSLVMEWDPLPHRFVLDSHYLNSKDYFADMDYSWRDVVVVNILTRGIFRNMEHLSFGADDPATGFPSFTDRDPGDVYGLQTRISKGFFRFKLPDFPLHVFAEVRHLDRKGTFQQRFLHANYRFPPAKISESRTYETEGIEVSAGMNSHLGPVEIEYVHSQKELDVTGEKVLTDAFSNGVPGHRHNLVPDLESSADTIKLHTSLTGRLVAGATYTSGDKKNKDSDSKAEYSMTAGDVTLIPINNLALFLKYRHYETENKNPDTVIATTMLGPVTNNVRDSLTVERDTITGTARYRASEDLSFKAEYDVEAYQRKTGIFGTNLPAPPAGAPAFWDLPKETTKGSAKLGVVYRLLRTILVRADYRRLSVDNPAYDTDPDSGDYAKTTVTWTPSPVMNFAVGYNGGWEERDYQDLALPGRKREASREQAIGSMTFIIAKRSSITATYSYFKNKVEQGIVFDNGTTTGGLERDAPYTDKSQSASLAVTHSPMDGVTLALEGKWSAAKGSFTLPGAVTGSNGITELSDIKLSDNEVAAEIDVQLTKLLGYQVRYQRQEWDDKLDNSQDGTAETLLASLSLRW
ncbi:MAG TPA: hypothetical protein VN604_08210 [Nitrospirota bacterium]|nr:hypothetical protein [Nitrospirota bacterium]